MKNPLADVLGGRRSQEVGVVGGAVAGLVVVAAEHYMAGGDDPDKQSDASAAQPPPLPGGGTGRPPVGQPQLPGEVEIDQQDVSLLMIRAMIAAAGADGEGEGSVLGGFGNLLDGDGF